MGRKRKSDQPETFAAMVDEVVTANPEPGGQPVDWDQPIRTGQYTDESGVHWHLRGGGDPPWKRVERLIHDPHVRVLHFALNELHEVSSEQREEFLMTIRPYLDGKSAPVGADYTHYRAGEFKDDQHRSLLIVEETC